MQIFYIPRPYHDPQYKKENGYEKRRIMFVLERVPVKLHAETVETLRRRGGAHGSPRGKKYYKRQDNSWQKEEI